jgi:glycosyltransferase involved in cell wall biosynthesis
VTDHLGTIMHVSVVVPCYDRTALLERTLRACFLQIVPPTLRWEILVADNHPEQLARSLVEGLQHASPVPLVYLAAPARNIARARNVAVAAARGIYVAFVDDDEAPLEIWLAAFHACMERTGADAAFGPKMPVFPGGAPPRWDPQAANYTTDFRVPTDTVIGRVGKFGRVLGTGNSIMRVATTLNMAEPFDENIGAADGEDTHLYFRLLKLGRRFVWCSDAVVHEVMQPSRLEYDYMWLRLKRGAQTSARCRISVSDHRVLTHAILTCVGLAQVVVHATLAVLTGEFFARTRVAHRLGIARGLGKLSYRSGWIGFIAEHQPPASTLSAASS